MSAGYIFTGTGNWALPFLVAAGFAVVAFLIFYFLVVPEPLAFGSARLEPRLPASVTQEL
jgi:hypothetical protein